MPTTTAPAARTRSTTVASYGGRQPSRIRDEHVVATPRVQMLSLSASGTPASGPGSSPRATAASIASAAARASSASTRLNAWMSGSRAVDRARDAPRRRRGRERRHSHVGGDGAALPESALTAPPRGCAAHGTGRSSASGAAASTSSCGRHGRRDVGPEHVHERQRVRGRRNVARCRAPTPRAA